MEGMKNLFSSLVFMIMIGIILMSGCSSLPHETTSTPVTTQSIPDTSATISPSQITTNDNSSIPLQENLTANCGRNVCQNSESCCNGFCYDPSVNVCESGKLYALSCDGVGYDVHVKNDFICNGNLTRPNGEKAQGGRCVSLTPSCSRPKSGASMPDNLKKYVPGPGNSLNINNQGGYDAIITLQESNIPPASGGRVVSFYVRAFDQYKFTYAFSSNTLSYKLGECWDPYTGDFTVDKGTKRLEGLNYNYNTAGWMVTLY